MKNTEIGFYSFKQYLPLDVYIDVYRCTSEVIMQIQLKYFRFLSMYLKHKAFKYLKNESFLAISSNVSYLRDICYLPRHRKKRLR